LSSTVVVLLYIVVILVVVLVHEAAHFGVAKAFRIKVEEFFVGFGPRIWSFRRGETEYGLKALPLGGYVRIAGMNPFQEPTPEDLPRTFGAKPIWQRAAVIAAGPATHFVMAFLFLFVYLAALGVPSKFEPLVLQVDRKIDGKLSPAAKAGLKAGDVIVGVDAVRRPGDQQLVGYTRRHVNEPIMLTVQRDDRTFRVTVTPVLATVEGERVGRIGVLLGQGDTIERDRKGVLSALGDSARGVSDFTIGVVKSMGRVFGPSGLGRIGDLLFGNAQRRPGDVTSVVGGARIAVQAAEVGASDVLFRLFAVFNVFVGILNLLPLPPFDGGHLAVLAVEKVRGRKVDMRKLIPLTAAVGMFLVLFMVSIIYLDVVKPIPNVFR
jgi:membrane-associated protease RseP (regulator of RpoE activity)